MANATTFDIALQAAMVREAAIVNAPIEYRIDSKGRKVRVPSAARPISYAEVRDMLLHNRVLEVEVILEAVGPSTFAYMKKAGQLVEDTGAADRFWITKKAAVQYDLPEYLGARTFIY